MPRMTTQATALRHAARLAGHPMTRGSHSVHTERKMVPIRDRETHRVIERYAEYGDAFLHGMVDLDPDRAMNIARGIAAAGFCATAYVFRSVIDGHEYAHVSATTLHNLRGRMDVIDYRTDPYTTRVERVDEDDAMVRACWHRADAVGG